jgi:hypothetical protein
MDLYQYLIIGHLLGTVLGVGGATFIEVHLNMAIGEAKRAVMAKDFLMTRIGLGLCFLTGLGFIWIYYDRGQIFRLSDGVFIAKMTIIGILVLNAVLLHKHKIGLYWGSALSFVSWWAAFLLGIFLTQGIKILPANDLLSFISIMAVYGVMVAAGAQILHRIREYIKGRQTPPTPPVPPPQQAVSAPQ